MASEYVIRPVREEDLPGLKNVLEQVELFPSDMLEDMVDEYLHVEGSPAMWFTAEQDGDLLSIGYCDEETLTEGTYNLYAIGVKEGEQGRGIGSAMMDYVEKELLARKARVLIVETSSVEDYEQSRDFYLGLGYREEARIADFWGPGDDKVVFWKGFSKG